MQDLTLPAARTERDQLAGRTDVLDKVGVLRTLPDDMNALTPMVAEFYGVGLEAVKSAVKDNREELEEDGYRVVIRSEFERFYEDLSNLDPRARQIALFPRRAILRIGMLLRDSDVARRVRDMLLDVERADATVHFLIPKTLPEALRAYATEVEAHELTTARADAAETSNRVLVSRIEKDAPLVAKAEAHTASITWIHRQDFAREVKQWGVGRGIAISHEHVYELLRRKKMMIAGDRSDRNQASSHAITAGWARNTKGTAENGHEYVTTRISPRGQDVAWKWITAHVEQFGTLAPQEVSA
ncbi:MAG: phage antirepressor KilAC domain-containing protein [Gordonia sp. (in: high G+C Gram-positive bacteria)]|uniref:phage antirepressor KilAC domain-containing protein n=1 Tax=Gordonia sp. (in: high G+C Gram-positive bacteria) TaxID=84139 RepID=UPI003C727F26